MKKFITILLIFIFSLTVSAEEYFDLEWKDIAPKRYKNIKEGKFYFTRNARYWSDIKVHFEKRLQICKNLEEETKHDDCLNRLLMKEKFYTQQYNEENRFRILKKLLILNII